MQRTTPLLAAATLLVSAVCVSSLAGQVLPTTNGLNKYMPKNEPTGTGGTGEWKDAQNNVTHFLDAQALIATAMASTAYNGLLGIARDGIKGHYWISARRDTTNLINPHKLFELDRNGKFVKAYDQPAATLGSAWGIRDLAVGIGGNGMYIYGGAENSVTGNKVFAFNVITGLWDATADWVAPAAPLTTIRALAYDPNGNNGQGSMYAADFSSTIIEFSRTGAILRQIAAGINGVPTAHTSYGAAYDPDHKVVWFFGQGGSTNTNSLVTGFELDTTRPNLIATGTVFFSDQTLAHTVPNLGGIAGGLAFYKRQNGDPILLCLHQASSDSLIEIYGRFENRASTSGGRIGMDFGGSYVGNGSWRIRLDSTAQSAALYFAIRNWNIDFTIAGFAPGSRLLLDPTAIFLPLTGFMPVTGGLAAAPIAIPADPTIQGIGLFFQWVEVPAAGQPRLSSGGGTVIRARL